MSHRLKPIRCTPQYYPKIWGGDRLAPIGSKDKIGEVWLLSGLADRETLTVGDTYGRASLDYLVALYGDRLLGEGQTARAGGAFPLLVKLLDAAEDLSVQVHPSRQQGGKDEVWYFLDTASGSRIGLGLTEPMTSEYLRTIIKKDKLVSYLHWETVSSGDAVALPAGTIHALGSGNMLIEVQDTSDATYRLYDYDRVDIEGYKRPLHIDEALESASLEPYRDTARQLPLSTGRFECSELIASATETKRIDTARTSCVVLVGISGVLELYDDRGESWSVRPYEALLIPAETVPITVARGNGSVMMITLTPA